MKKLLLSLMVLASLVSCGKDNKVSSGSSTSTITVTNPVVTNSSVAQTLIAQINNPSTGFGNGVIQSGSTQQCETKWGGFLQYCYSSSSNSTTTTWNAVVASKPNLVYIYSNYEQVTHSAVVVATKQNELLSLLNSATNITVQGMTGGNVYYIYVSGGVYVVDTRYPIQANPSGVQTSSSYKFLYTAQ